MANEIPELKSCPFCGGAAEYKEFPGEYMNVARCTNYSTCDASTSGEFIDDPTTIPRWNTRHAPTVKPLVWELKPAGLETTTLFGTAIVYETFLSGWFLTATGMGQVESLNFKTQEAAQKEFQTYYDQLILSALE